MLRVAASPIFVCSPPVSCRQIATTAVASPGADRREVFWVSAVTLVPLPWVIHVAACKTLFMVSSSCFASSCGTFWSVHIECWRPLFSHFAHVFLLSLSGPPLPQT